MKLTAHWRAFAGHTAVALASVAISTAVTSAMHVNATTAGFAFLLVVLAVATAWGMPAAAIAAIAATACFNFYFLPPIGQFTIADPQNWVALFAFLATALVASHLSQRVKRQAAEATARQRETEQLYTLSRTILLTDHSRPVGSQAVQHIAEIFGCPAVALYNAKTGEIFRGGAEELPDIEAKLKQVVMEGSRLRDDTLAAAIMLGGHPMGSIAMKCLTLSDGALHALLNLVAIALERVRTEEAANRAEASRQSEEFKSTLLDAIAHEFKTPLTSIKAASTSMLSDGVLPPPSRELVSIIDEEADRLSMLVTEAVRMAQIDAGKIRLERRAVDAGDLIHRVLAHFEPRSEGRAMHVTVDEGVPPAWADSELVSLALRQLIDNALKYSAQGSRLEIAVRAKDDSVEIRIRDHGPGIPVTEQERIFEKFYRRPGSKVPGTGLGLYIAREILRTHGGDVWVEGEPGWGSEFCVALPTQKEAARR